MAVTDWLFETQGTNLTFEIDEATQIAGIGSLRVENFNAELASLLCYPGAAYTTGHLSGRIRMMFRRTLSIGDGAASGPYFMASQADVLTSGSCYYIHHQDGSALLELRKTNSGLTGLPGATITSFNQGNTGTVGVLEVEWFSNIPINSGTKIIVRYAVDVPDFTGLPTVIDTTDISAALETSVNEGIYAASSQSIAWDTEFDQTEIISKAVS